MYEVKNYIGNYNKNEFYMIMGKFFAERIYRKQLPYLINDKNKIWYLFYKGKELAGFCGVKICQQYTDITDIYYIEKYKEENIAEFIIYFIFNTYKLENIKVLTNNEHEKELWQQLGLIQEGNKGCYTTLKWRRKDE